MHGGKPGKPDQGKFQPPPAPPHGGDMPMPAHGGNPPPPNWKPQPDEKPAPGPHHTAPVPRPPVVQDYRPGYYRGFIPEPRRADFYENWQKLQPKFKYSVHALPDRLRTRVKKNKTIPFSIEENTTTGYCWIVRSSSSNVSVKLTHCSAYMPGKGMHTVGTPGWADIQVTGRKKGMALVELVYVREWEWKNGAPPIHVIQLFVEVK